MRHIDERILLLTPTGRDAALAATNLGQQELDAQACRDFDDFLSKLSEGAAVGILAEEAMSSKGLEALAEWIAHQPPWSDFPLILIGSMDTSTGHSSRRYATYQKLGNLTILERPFHRETLLIAAQSAMRNRRRQYEARAFLLERQHAAEELERQVEERTHALTEAREALLQAQKLEAIGRLAGGVAHDFNNLMTGIQGIAEDLHDQATDAEQKSELSAILDAASRASALTRQLLAFGRKQIVRPTVLDVNATISEMESLFRRLLREDLRLELRLQPGLVNISMDRTGFEQVMINLVMNSRDAMPHGGTIRIETKLLSAVGKDPGHVQLIVSDTGVGMSSETVAHIFEPFFTTKSFGKGTGLGLATVYGHIKRSDGDISVSSEPDKGTTLTIVWPAVNAPADHVVAPSTQVPRGTETILLVEDEDIVRNVAANALERQGYRVLQASGGSQAIQIYADSAEPIDLLLVDVVMPYIDGSKVVETLVTPGSPTAVLYMSGHTNDIIMRKGVVDESIAFIGKPFTAAELARKVRHVLDSHRQSLMPSPR